MQQEIDGEEREEMVRGLSADLLDDPGAMLEGAELDDLLDDVAREVVL